MQLPKFPILAWRKHYNKDKFTDDILAAIIVAIMLIPQALAYATLAELPPETGIYASIFGLIAYSLFGSSNTLSVAPVAVVSLMTATALGRLGLTSPEALIAAATTLALLSGAMLLLLGFLRLGFLANFISSPVITAFINAAVIIIAFSQLRTLLGVDGNGQNLPELITSLATRLQQTNGLTLTLGLTALAFMFWCKRGLKNVLLRLGINQRIATLLTRSGPLFVVAISALLAYGLNLQSRGVRVLGNIPDGLPGIAIPPLEVDLLLGLWGSALLISIIGFVESVSVAKNLAAKRHEQINLDQELVGLGAANVSSAFGGGFPVTGGFARSVVNFDAGAATPAAGLMSALILLPVALLFTPLLYWIPQVSLAAIILVAIAALIDFSPLRRAWTHSKADFVVFIMTFILTLLIGIEIGIASGIILSLLIRLYKTSRL
ncbi:MAG: SulP family inorganic anion transporter [Pseudohongiellaceae bacterium]